MILERLYIARRPLLSRVILSSLQKSKTIRNKRDLNF